MKNKETYTKDEVIEMLQGMQHSAINTQGFIVGHLATLWVVRDLIHLPVARGGYHGLYIELKVGSNKATALQKDWIKELTKQGYLAVVCYGWQEAAEQLVNYLELDTARYADKAAGQYADAGALMPAT